MPPRKYRRMLPNNSNNFRIQNNQNMKAKTPINNLSDQSLIIIDDTDDDCVCLDSSNGKIIIIDDDPPTANQLCSPSKNDFIPFHQKEGDINGNDTNLSADKSTDLNCKPQSEIDKIDALESLPEVCKPSTCAQEPSTSLSTDRLNDSNKDDVCILNDTVENGDGDDSVIFINETFINDKSKVEYSNIILLISLVLMTRGINGFPCRRTDSFYFKNSL